MHLESGYDYVRLTQLVATLCYVSTQVFPCKPQHASQTSIYLLCHVIDTKPVMSARRLFVISASSAEVSQPHQQSHVSQALSFQRLVQLMPPIIDTFFGSTVLHPHEMSSHTNTYFDFGYLASLNTWSIDATVNRHKFGSTIQCPHKDVTVNQHNLVRFYRVLQQDHPQLLQDLYCTFFRLVISFIQDLINSRLHLKFEGGCQRYIGP